jgi:predicted amidohydrolase YtcJ
VTITEALRLVTIEPAYQLHLDHLVGSIEVGKQADFTILKQDPTLVDPMAIRDIPVVGTVRAGEYRSSQVYSNCLANLPSADQIMEFLTERKFHHLRK